MLPPWRQVVEFVDFKERLGASHTRALGRAEEAALALRFAAAGSGADKGAGLLLAALEGAVALQVGGTAGAAALALAPRRCLPEAPGATAGQAAAEPSSCGAS